MTRKTTPSELHRMLCAGKVTFQYTKNDGTVRQAVGTLNAKLIANKPAGGQNKTKAAGYTTYYDLEKEAFRCFAESKLVGIVEA